MDTNQEKILEKAQERVIETLARNMDLYGITMSTGLLYGTLLFQDKSMTLDEMGEALGMSKTSMSTGVRTLMDLNMVEKIWKKGTRKDHYEVNLDWYQNFIDLFSVKWRHACEHNVHALKKSLLELRALQQSEELTEEVRERVDLSIKRIENGLEYYLWLSRLIDSFESHDIFQFVPKKENES
ncbi:MULTISPECIES: GbsR/MarR family transcriptional regulator [Brevibacillus]|uniref:HTH-type transcriptional regulator n=1 Tax=Brevibacillus brevis TaxID=1393 RepID=A0A2Z4MP51_BREBE|nr:MULTISPECIES: transcriptional regulator [Brevibacillus]AWX58312.1 GbsR/MarR family transcriptional regulator [Brevibacillus brevis]NRR23739.1 GbsR/MarR family transcriptional regulator [Brevibacillus sp. MS2.2]